jgi:hypothetical protein
MQVKGTAISFIPNFLQEKFGKDRYASWVASLPDKSKAIFGGSVLASQWYPFQDGFIVPMRKICDTFYAGNPKGAYEMGRYSADYGLRGVYKILVRFGSPESLAKKAGTIMPTYYQPSSIEVVEAIPRKAILRVTQFSEYDIMVENRLCGYFERAIEVCGGKTPKVQVTSSLSRGHPKSEFLITWN